MEINSQKLNFRKPCSRTRGHKGTSSHNSRFLIAVDKESAPSQDMKAFIEQISMENDWISVSLASPYL